MSRLKIEKIFFYFLIFAIPFETRLIWHKWLWSFNEWTSAYLYATDILIIGLLFFWAIRVIKGESPGVKWSIKNPDTWLVIFFLISALSITSSKIIGLSVYQLVKLAEFIALFFYIKANTDKIIEFKKVLEVIIVSGAFQAIVGILQYAKQGSLGLRIFGESPLSVDTTGVAVFIADAHKYMRAYGATPHPNILAAWLFVAIFAFYNLYLYSGSRDFSRKNIFLLIIYAVTLVGFFLTFSRTIIALWLLGAGIRLFMAFFKRRLFDSPAIAIRRTRIIFFISTAVVLLFSIYLWPQVKARVYISSDEEAVIQRVFYNEAAVSMTRGTPILGVGIGQFVPSLMEKLRYYPKGIYQPVHNIYLLIVSETGVFGLLVFLLFLFSVFWQFYKKTRLKTSYYFSFFVFSLSFLLMGLFDHFLWTLQQGSLIFWMAMALVSVDM